MNLKDKTVVIDNKAYRYSKIVMLATNDASILSKDIYNRLYLGKYPKDKRELNLNQHLYFLSTDKVRNGDWCIRDTQVFKATNIINGDIEFIDEDGQLMYYGNWACTKIITSTNPSLNLPKPSNQFLQVYIDCFNKNEKIEECLVEYEQRNISDNEGFFNLTLLPKVTKGEITIRKIKDSWSNFDLKQELELLISVNEDDFDRGKGKYILKKWIEQNL